MTTSTHESQHDGDRDLRILRIDASGRRRESVTRQLGDAFIGHLQQLHPHAQVTVRDVADGLPFVDEAWIKANFTGEDQRDARQRTLLEVSDSLVRELQQTDIVVIGVPVYNFGVPAALKAWIDLVARAGLTFRYTEQGPVGLLNGRKVYLLLASGGVPVGSEIDFASRYLRHMLGFLGLREIEIIAADGLATGGPTVLDRALRETLASAAQLAAEYRHRAA